MLIDDERDLVLRRLETYPAGVPDSAWGSGPMAELDETGQGLPPDVFSAETLDEYG